MEYKIWLAFHTLCDLEVYERRIGKQTNWFSRRDRKEFTDTIPLDRSMMPNSTGWRNFMKK